MPDLNYEVRHLKGDVAKIHDDLEHLSSHSKICNALIRDSNLREATELFRHLEQIDKLIHEVQTHIIHINDHIEQDPTSSVVEEPLDIDDLKHDAKHTSMDLKDIHANIEHLITHANMCVDIMAPKAEEELGDIKQHLNDIDEKAHELLDHVNSIRGGISTIYPEFVWSIPEGMDEYLTSTSLIDSDALEIKTLALKLVDGADTIQSALINILYFVRDFISPNPSEDKPEYQASKTIEKGVGGGIAKSILACALARAVSIPSRIHFWYLSYDARQDNEKLKEIIEAKGDLSITSPEFYIKDNWESAHYLISKKIDVSHIHEKFIDLGIPKPTLELSTHDWRLLPISYLPDDGSFDDPKKYLDDEKLSKLDLNIDCRLFAGYIYNGSLSD